MIFQEMKIKQSYRLLILLSFMVLLQSCGSSSSVTPATPLVSPKIYLTDTFNGRVVRLDDMSGNFSYWITRSGFFNPKGIYLDSSGKIYVADTGNNRIVRMDDITGTNWTAFATSGSNQFSAPSGINVDPSGNIFVSDTGNHRIIKIDTTGTWTLFGATVGGNGTNQFSNPSGLFVDAAGKIYVSDTGNNRIVRTDDMSGTNWVAFAKSGSNQFTSPSGIYVVSSTVNSTGRIYVSDTGNNRIVQMDDMTGTNWTSFGSSGNGLGQFSSPTGIFVDIAGKIYVSDTGNNRIVRIDDMTGTNWFALGSWGPGLNQFNHPSFAVFQ